MKAVVALAVAIGLATSLPNCGSDAARLELSRYLGVMQAQGSDQVRVAFGRCGNEHIKVVVLSNGGSETRLWRIDAAGSSQTRFVLGETPPGFRTSVPLRTPLPEHEYLTLKVRTDNRRWPVTSVTFRLDELRPGLFHSDTGPELPFTELKSRCARNASSRRSTPCDSNGTPKLGGRRYHRSCSGDICGRSRGAPT